MREQGRMNIHERIRAGGGGSKGVVLPYTKRGAARHSTIQHNTAHLSIYSSSSSSAHSAWAWVWIPQDGQAREHRQGEVNDVLYLVVAQVARHKQFIPFGRFVLFYRCRVVSQVMLRRVVQKGDGPTIQKYVSRREKALRCTCSHWRSTAISVTKVIRAALAFASPCPSPSPLFGCRGWDKHTHRHMQGVEGSGCTTPKREGGGISELSAAYTVLVATRKVERNEGRKQTIPAAASGHTLKR